VFYWTTSVGSEIARFRVINRKRALLEIFARIGCIARESDIVFTSKSEQSRLNLIAIHLAAARNYRSSLSNIVTSKKPSGTTRSARVANITRVCENT
jgi:hypothetical protein